MTPIPSDRLQQTLHAAADGDPRAASELLPLVYEDLRSLARARMAALPPGNTLQPTALVHEAFMRVAKDDDSEWNSRRHFFAAAAQSMRQILVDQVRRKKAVRHGGDQQRVDIDLIEIAFNPPTIDAMRLHVALEKLEREDPRKAQIVLHRFFAGLDREETAACLDISLRTVDREWTYILAWLHREMNGDPALE
jgi:RNA polymerase sigma factor (TIGR02999 family)